MPSRRLVVAAAIAGAVLVGGARLAWATFTASATATATYTSATLAAPTNPATAAGTCSTVTGDQITVTWTATASTWADGYEIRRSVVSGGPYTVVGTVSGRTTTSFTNGSLLFSTTYYYVVRSTKGAWRSADAAQVSRTTRTALCT